MRLLVALVIAIAAGCGGGSPDSVDMSLLPGCHVTIDEGQACKPECLYLGDPCYCSATNIWTCPHRDMATTD